jgi:hypothetical protein
VAAVQYDEHVGAANGDLTHEPAQLDVGEVIPAVRAAVMQHECLVEPVRLEHQVLLRRLLLRAVPTVVEDGRVAGTSIGEGRSERADQPVTGRLLIQQHRELRSHPFGLGSAGEYLLGMMDVVAAPAERGDAA